MAGLQGRPEGQQEIYTMQQNCQQLLLLLHQQQQQVEKQQVEKQQATQHQKNIREQSVWPQEQQQPHHQQNLHPHADAQQQNQSASPEQSVWPEQLSSSHCDSPVAVANVSSGMHAPAPVLHLDLPSPPLSAATLKSRRELHRRATASTMEHCRGQQLSPVEQQQQHRQHWHGSTSGNTTPTSRGGAHNLYAYRSPISPASIPRVDSDASGSIFGPESVHSFGDGFGGNDASETTTPTNTDDASGALHTNWWQLQTDMEGVTIGGSSSVGADMDMSFLEGACDDLPHCDLPEVLPEGGSGDVPGMGAGDDFMGASGVLGMGVGRVKLEAVPEGNDSWGAEAPAALKQDWDDHQAVGMEHQLEGSDPGSFYDASHFMPDEDWLPSLADAGLNDASWHIHELEGSLPDALPPQHADVALHGGRTTGQGPFNDGRISLPQAEEEEGSMFEDLPENGDVMVEGEASPKNGDGSVEDGVSWAHSASRPLSSLLKERAPAR